MSHSKRNGSRIPGGAKWFFEWWHSSCSVFLIPLYYTLRDLYLGPRVKAQGMRDRIELVLSNRSCSGKIGADGPAESSPAIPWPHFSRKYSDAIARSSIQHSLVVVGHHRAEIASRLHLPNLIFNPDYAQGMITSFQTGIRALPALYRRAAFSRRPPAGRCRDDQSAPGQFRCRSDHGAGFQRTPRPSGAFLAEILQEILALPARKGLISWYERTLAAL